MLTKRSVIEHLNMRPHEEGGFASPTYSGDRWSVAVPGWPGGERAVLNSIFYMLTDDAPVGVLHRNRCDIVHFFHGGYPLLYLLVSPEGLLERRILGPDFTQGQRLQLVVPGGYWKGTMLTGGELGLLGEAAAPGWDPRDRDFATEADLAAWSDDVAREVRPLLRKP